MIRDSFGYYHLKGCIHMHTTDSDGASSHSEVAAFANEVGLDYIMFTDHMTLQSRQSAERFYDDLLVVVGYEHNDPADQNHYLLFGASEVYDEKLTPQEYIDRGVADNAVGFLAHPDEVRSRDGEYPPYPWTDWPVERFTGIEIWNQMSEWMEKLASAGPLGKAQLLFSPRKFMTSPPATTLKRWDELNLSRKAVGIGGVDAHAHPHKLGPKTITIFPYKVHFRSLQTHVILTEPLSRDYPTARGQLLEALRDARVYVSNRRWGAAGGFIFRAVRGSEMAICGGSIPIAEGCSLEVALPRAGEIRLFHNGSIILTTRSKNLSFSPSSPGVYRVEVYQGPKGWIFSNHIRIGV